MSSDRVATEPVPARRRSELWLKLVMSLGTLLVMLPVMELAVRLLAPQLPSWLSIYRRHPALPTYAYQPNVRTTVDTGEARWVVCTDANGFRVAQQPVPEDGRPLALWLGDSFAFGYSVDYEDSFIGRLALDPDRRYRHVNAAIGGHGPVQYRQTLEYQLARGLDPRVVLVSVFLGNDFIDCIVSKDFPVKDGILGNEGGLKSFVKQRSHLYRISTNALHRFAPAGDQDVAHDIAQANARDWNEGDLHRADLMFRREFEAIADICRKRGTDLRVVVIPLAPMVDAVAKGTATSPERDMTLAEKHAVATFEALGIRYLDLTPMLTRHPTRETYFYFDGHFRPRGHALVADEIRREWADLVQ